MVVTDLILKLEEVKQDYPSIAMYANFRLKDGCIIIQGIDKERELVIYSDLSHEVRPI